MAPDPSPEPRPVQITRSAFVCGGISLLLIAIVIQAAAYGKDVGSVGAGALAIALAGLACAFLLLTLNRFARLGLAAFWLALVGGAIYSTAYLRSANDYRGVLGIIGIACGGIVLWHAVHKNWPRSRPRSTTQR